VPELPEVETVRRHLAPRVEGRVLERVEVLDPRWCRPLEPEELAAAIQGRRLDRLARRGKYLVAHLEGDVHLIMHLRMTGTVLYDADAALPHTRVRIGLDDGHRLSWVDPRRFGTGELALDSAQLEAFFALRLGAEPLSEAFTVEGLRAAARDRRAPVKAFLLDQRRVAGVGNIYADEALFRAGIHPLRPTGRLTRRQLAALHEAVEETLRAGIASKGASIDDFRDPDGVMGSFQDEFLVHLREGAPCSTCGRPIKKIVAAGRGTYVCETCQPRPRRARRGREKTREPRGEPRGG
jgi:formamidopyrimidine-DNA glycosylase